MMTRRSITWFLAVSLGIYVLATSLGVLMRFSYLTPMPWLPFKHAIHAHSHTLYFGWVGLALLALAFRLVGDEGKAVRVLLSTIAALSLATFVSFLNGGYTTLSIIISTAFLFVWAWGIVRWWRGARGRSGLAFTYLRVGMCYLGIASLGAWGRVVLLAMHVENPIYGKLSVFAFLYNFGWFFVFGVIGLAMAWAPKWRVNLDERLLRLHLLWAAPVAWVTFPLGVAGGERVAFLGPTARLAAAVLIVPGVLLTWALVKAARSGSGPMRQAFGWLGFWYGAKTAMEVAGAFGLSSIAVSTRHPAVLYLHVFLLGFVTVALLLPVLSELKRPLGKAFAGHNIGLLIMGVGLAMLSGPPFGVTWLVQYLRLGFFIAALGGAVVLVAGAVWAWPRKLEQEEALGIDALTTEI